MAQALARNRSYAEVINVIEIPISPCEELVSLGERELAAFIRTVTELFGADQAHVAAEDWLESVALLDCASPRPSHSWRLVTIAATTQFLERVVTRDVVTKDACQE